MTIETNGFGAESQFMVMVGGPQNHWKTIEINGLGAESQFMVMVEGPKNHWKTIESNVMGAVLISIPNTSLQLFLEGVGGSNDARFQGHLPLRDQQA